MNTPALAGSLPSDPPKATAVSAENEVVIYGRITNFSGLEKAVKVVHQEQYELKPAKKGDKPDKGKIRVRKETIMGVETYTLTTKVTGDSSEMASNKEYTIAIDREFFDAFKAIANSGMIKTRYYFPLAKMEIMDHSKSTVEASSVHNEPEAFYEVDVFSRPDGMRFTWCKIDLELDEVMKLAFANLPDNAKLKIVAKVSDLPFLPVESFTGKDATPEQNKLLDWLYKEVFTTRMD